MPFTAILNASRAAGGSSGLLRGQLHFAGQSLVEYQARQAAAAGADTVMIVVSAVTQPISRAVDNLTADGIAVMLIRDMVSIVRSAPRDRDLLLVADGVIVPQHHFEAMARETGNWLLVARDSRASERFERIDAARRWAGLARMTPDLLFSTLDMIGDWDLELTLVRAAVQAGAQCREVRDDDVLEGRIALIETQQEADIAGAALLSTPSHRPDMTGIVDGIVIAPVASWLSGLMLRGQVPALQVQIGAATMAAIGILAALLSWTVIAIPVLLFATLFAHSGDRLIRLARRDGQDRAAMLAAPVLVLAGIAMIGRAIGRDAEGLYLALLLGVIAMAGWKGRLLAVPRWAIFSPTAALLILFAGIVIGQGAFSLMVANIYAIATLGFALGGVQPRKPDGNGTSRFS
ncbi:hypothetical protein [Sphingobium aquiterrae]|uniref:hypothetical protein n=1 Tax=Sphingobium aquiterrae TaxID=2038656 RepID=UPI003017B9B9